MIKLKQIFLVLLIAIFSISSCDDNKEIAIICEIKNPLEELSFLKEAKDNIDRIDCAGKSTITQYTYNSKIVFEVLICGQIANAQTLVYNCAGETICSFSGIIEENTCPDFEEKRTNKILLYGN